MRTLFTIFFALFSSHAVAEPPPAMQTLMERPLSLFDWGMFRLGEQLKRANTDAYPVYGEWDDHKIFIVTSIFLESKTTAGIKAECEKVFSENDRALMIFEGADSMPKFCFFCSFFGHSGYSTEKITKAQEKMKESLYYRVDNISTICERKAYGTSISIK